MEIAELWGKGWSLRPEQDPRTMTYIGTITRAGMNFHYYRGDDGEIYFDDVLIRKDGRFVLPELECLNPENLM